MPAQDWLTLLYYIRGYLSSLPRPWSMVVLTSVKYGNREGESEVMTENWTREEVLCNKYKRSGQEGFPIKHTKGAQPMWGRDGNEIRSSNSASSMLWIVPPSRSFNAPWKRTSPSTSFETLPLPYANEMTWIFAAIPDLMLQIPFFCAILLMVVVPFLRVVVMTCYKIKEVVP